jgi:hypothetical protein
MLETLIAILYLFLLAFTILFQIGLMVKKPWGEWTMGGYIKGVLPTKLRFAAFLSFLILVFFSLVVINKVGLFGANFNFLDWSKLWSKFLIIGFNVLAVIANSATRSLKERKLWQPITILMLLCSLALFL